MRFLLHFFRGGCLTFGSGGLLPLNALVGANAFFPYPRTPADLRTPYPTYLSPARTPIPLTPGPPTWLSRRLGGRVDSPIPRRLPMASALAFTLFQQASDLVMYLSHTWASSEYESRMDPRRGGSDPRLKRKVYTARPIPLKIYLSCLVVLPKLMEIRLSWKNTIENSLEYMLFWRFLRQNK